MKKRRQEQAARSRQAQQDRRDHPDQHEHDRPGSTGTTREPPPRRPEPISVDQLVRTAAHCARGSAAKDAFELAVQKLVERETAEHVEEDQRPRRVLSRLLAGDLATLFDNGWQPADVAHWVKRVWSARAHRLVIGLIAAHARGVDAPNRAPQAWLAQLEDLGAYDSRTSTITGGQGEVTRRWAAAERLHVDESLAVQLQVLALLQAGGRLSFLLEPPARWTASNRGSLPPEKTAAPRGDVDAKALKLIRALLAKAEATNFEAEAEAFTAKAQQMMTRHSIDAAVLAAASKGAGAEVGVESRRVHIDNPYADEKATFLSILADVNSARAIWSPDYGFSTIMGFAVDLHLTDLLFTSLLVQATRASAEATSAVPASRTRSYRRAFLLSYAYRIGERLRAAERQTATEAEEEYGDALLPILAHRQAAVEEAFAEAFPNVRMSKARSLDAAGYHDGRAAADRAHLRTGEALSRPA